MKKYDVLILCRFFRPDQITAANLAFETAEDLVKKGLKVKVVCGRTKGVVSNKKAPKKETINNIEIRRLNYLQLSKSSKMGRIISYLAFILAIIVNWRLLVQTKCVVVYSDPPIMPFIAALNKKMFKINFIFVSYDIFPDIPIATKHISEKSVICKVMKKSNDFVDKNVSEIVALSNDMKDYILKTRKYISEDRIKVIPNWSSLNNIDFSKEIQNYAIKELSAQFEIIILYSGNMGIAQDMNTILDSAKYMKNSENVLFVFTGNGQKVDHIKSEVNRLNLNNVRVYDYLKNQDYIDMLRAADAHVISLVEDISGMAVPSKTYSYMAIGRPLIAIMSEHTDIAIDIKNYELGCVINPNDIDKFVNYVEYLLENKNEVFQIGNRVLKVFNNKYTQEINTKKYYKMIKGIID